MADSWILDRTCACPQPKWGHGTWDNQKLSLQERLSRQPPSCLTCGKWHKSRIYVCVKCDHNFVNWFSHPASGYYPNRGFYCYFCLEALHPTGVSWTYAQSRDWLENKKRTKIPPSDSIVSPAHIGAKKPTYDPETQARLDKFREFLKGI